ncbi:MAG: hypothetical protein ACI8P3_003505 [Saprospiraceae bacterium]|jgi:hypothetical protein
MIICTILYLLLGFNLIHMVTEENPTFYRDVRFWLIIFSLLVLILMTGNSYPV